MPERNRAEPHGSDQKQSRFPPRPAAWIAAPAPGFDQQPDGQQRQAREEQPADDGPAGPAGLVPRQIVRRGLQLGAAAPQQQQETGLSESTLTM